MENTIIKGAEVRIKKKALIKRNYIAAFRMPNSDEIKLSRVIGLPGDEIEIINGEIYVNGDLLQRPLLSRKIYTIYLSNPVYFNKLTKFQSRPYSNNYSMFSLSKLDYQEILAMNFVDSVYILGIDSNYVEQGIIKNTLFKYSNNFYFGPLKIPVKGTIIDDNILKVVPFFLSKSDQGEKIMQDYFFCIGDNFPESKDSRFIGLIPRTSILGIVDSFEKKLPVDYSE